jgi:hypothetical protein
MTTSKEHAIAAFLRGEPAQASRMESTTYAGVPCIIGSGWAVYAADLRECGPGPDAIVLYGDGHANLGTDLGWSGYSNSTTTHIHDIKAKLSTPRYGGRYRVADARPAATSTLRHRGEQADATPVSGSTSSLGTLAGVHGRSPMDTPRYAYEK